MLKNITKIEYKIGERTFELLCENDSPLQEVKEALFQFQKYVGHVEDSLRIQQEQAKTMTESEPMAVTPPIEINQETIPE